MQKVTRKRKKLLEIREDAKKLPSNLWEALGRWVGGGGGRGGQTRRIMENAQVTNIVLIPLDFASLFKSGFQ